MVALGANAVTASATAMVASDHGLAAWKITTSQAPQNATSQYVQTDTVEPSGSQTRPAYSVAVNSTGTAAVLGEDGMVGEVTRQIPNNGRPPKPDSLSLHGATGNVVAAALTDDARRLITTGEANSAVVWNTTT
jgi:hypothetical protein